MKTTHLLLCVLSTAAVIGCKSTAFVYTKADGGMVKASDRRLFLSTAAKLEVTAETNGTLRINADVKSDPHADAIKAAAEGAVQGALKAVGK